MSGTGEVVLSRRNLLGGAGGAALAAALVGLPGRWGRLQSPAAGLTLATVAPLVGSSFAVRLAPWQTEAFTLVAVDEYAPRAGAHPASGEAFSMLFASSARIAVPSATYQVHHPALGGFRLFLSPVGAGGDGPRYEAVVDRRVPAR